MDIIFEAYRVFRNSLHAQCSKKLYTEQIKSFQCLHQSKLFSDDYRNTEILPANSIFSQISKSSENPAEK